MLTRVKLSWFRSGLGLMIFSASSFLIVVAVMSLLPQQYWVSFGLGFFGLSTGLFALTRLRRPK